MSRHEPPAFRHRPRRWAAGLLSVGLVCAGMPAQAGDARRGRALAEQFQCGQCHRIPSVAAARGTSAPSLEGFGARSYIAGRIPNRDDSLTRWIVEPSSLVPGTAMPAMGANEAQARDIAAFLRTLKK